MAACCALAAFIIYNLVKVHDSFVKLDDSYAINKTDPNESDQPAQDGNTSPSVGHCRITLSGLTCASCVKAVRVACQSVPDVSEVTVSLHSLSLRARYQLSSSIDPTPSLLVTAIEKAGYQALSILPDADFKSQWTTSTKSRDKDTSHWNRSFHASVIASCIVAAIETGERVTPFSQAKLSPYVMTTKLCIGIVGLCLFTGPIHREAWGAIINMKPNASLISSCGLACSFVTAVHSMISGWSSPDATSGSFTLASVCLLMTVIIGGRLLRSLVAQRSSQLPSTLASAMPPTAHLLGRHNSTSLVETVAVEMLQRGNHVLVRANEPFPADGKIVHGTAWVLETIIRGEMIPRPVGPGDTVYTGCTNTSGEVVVEVCRIGSETWLGQTLQAISQENQSKMQLEGLSDRVLSVFSGGVIVLALVTGVSHFSAGVPYMVILRRVATVFLCACPCGLGLSVPTCVMAAISNAFQSGILLQPGPHLELLTRSRIVIFDKTGTLTLGKLEVQNVHLEPMWRRPHHRILFWELVGLLSQTSHHPASNILTRESKTQLSATRTNARNATYTLISHEEHPGLGLTGTIITDSTTFQLVVGNHRLHQRKSIYIEPGSPSKSTNTTVYISINNHLAGTVTLSDTIAPDAPSLINTLHNRHFTTFLLTGDTAPSAHAVAGALGIPTANTHASLLPRDKSDLVKKLQREYGPAIMIGDGLNDGPALLAASCSIAVLHDSMSRSKPESAGISACPDANVQLVPLSPESDRSVGLHRIVYLIDLAHATCARMRSALYWSMGYNVVALVLASGMVGGVVGWLDLSPLAVSIAMSVSSVLNLTYCLRLAGWSSPDAAAGSMGEAGDIHGNGARSRELCKI